MLLLEWRALPNRPTALAEAPTRHVFMRGVYREPEVNDPCRGICEPHCSSRWRSSGLTALPHRICFYLCIDLVCEARQEVNNGSN
jgi:hypothetical protein